MLTGFFLKLKHAKVPVSISFSQPPRASIIAFSSGERFSSACLSSHSRGTSYSTPAIDSMPLKYSPKARSNLSKFCSSFTSDVRER